MGGGIANQLTGFYMRATLVLNGLTILRGWRYVYAQRGMFHKQNLMMTLK